MDSSSHLDESFCSEALGLGTSRLTVGSLADDKLCLGFESGTMITVADCELVYPQIIKLCSCGQTFFQDFPADPSPQQGGRVRSSQRISNILKFKLSAATRLEELRLSGSLGVSSYMPLKIMCSYLMI